MDLVRTLIVLLSGEFSQKSSPLEQFNNAGDDFPVTLPVAHSVEPTITASAADLSVLLNKTETLEVSIRGLPVDTDIPLTFYVQHDDLIEVAPATVTLASNDEVYKVVVRGLHPG